jgi:hypothetical protein
MNHSRIFSLRSVLIAVITFSVLFAFKAEKDPLHKRTFHISLTESKDGVPAKKPISDEFYFKDGKVFSDFLYDKYGYKQIRYRINKDSVYTDSTDTEVRQLEIEASATNEENQTVAMTFTTVEWDIDGVIKITKNDKLKKYYDFAGREKGGKPKKEKKKKPEEKVAPAEPAVEMKKE